MERRGEGRTKVVYLAPLKALVAEKLNDWERRFGNGTRFNLRFVLLTGDVDEEIEIEFWREVDRADVILATPEKWIHCRDVIPQMGSLGFSDLFLWF